MRACTNGRSLPFLPVVRRAPGLKLVEFFPAHPLVEDGRGRALRVSRYLGEGVLRHVRFSVWKEQGRTAHAKAAVSLAEEEAERLARFPGEPADVPSGRPRAPR